MGSPDRIRLVNDRSRTPAGRRNTRKVTKVHQNLSTDRVKKGRKLGSKTHFTVKKKDRTNRSYGKGRTSKNGEKESEHHVKLNF